MKKIFNTLGFVALFPAMLWAQIGGIVNNGANIVISASTDVKLENGGLINQANGSVNNGGNIYIGLDWNQTGTSTGYSGNGWMWFEGIGNQRVTSSNPLSIPRLRVDNGNLVILNDDITVTTQVDLMNNGSILLGANDLVLTPGATIVNYDENNYIITNGTGVLQQEVGATNVVFPVGNVSYNPATLNNNGTTDNFLVRVFNQVLDQGTTGTVENTGVVGKTWMIDEEIIGGSVVNLVLQWQTPNELSFDRNNCGIAHHLNGSIWDNPTLYTAAAAVTPGTWTQSRSGLTRFSPFVIRDLTADLPVELLSFDAIRDNEYVVDLTWVTATETNNSGFDVERMLDTENSFSKIGWVEGQGTTVNTTYYELEDQNAHTGLTYYRLKQIDLDGTIAYSDIRVVDGAEPTGDINVFPIPTKNLLHISFSNWVKVETDVTINVVDVLGRILITKNTTIQPGSLIELTEVQDLLPGNYFVKVTSVNGLQQSRKFIRAEN